MKQHLHYVAAALAVHSFQDTAHIFLIKALRLKHRAALRELFVTVQI